ncbi:MAG: chromophore lyase CpcT/CpeT [Phycisphaerales bacterium]|nr:chromophore lyase CpcT/CpeT [Phycisphaerales bacterium]
MRHAVACLTLSPLLAGCAAPPAHHAPDAPPVPDAPTAADLDRLDTLASWMAGSFDSAEQAAADKSYFDIRLHMTPIWTERPGANAGSVRWLYVERATADQQARPYRQRIYRVSALGGGAFRSDVFEFPGDPLAFAGAWKNPALFASLKEDQLVGRAGCAVMLTDRADAFVGGTHEHDCISTLRGAAYATNETTVTADALISWDRGFDESGKQVWGATRSGYVFRKRAR